MISAAYGCSGGTASPAPEPAPQGEALGRPEPQKAPAFASPEVDGQIDRAALLPILDAGLGRFLQGVETRPHLVEGRFIGFRLLTLWPEDPRFRGIDLGPGDVVTRVNGQSIERPEQALQVWNGLRVASALYIEYVRDGKPREVRFAIVD